MMNSNCSKMVTDESRFPETEKMVRIMNGKQVDRNVLREEANIIACGNMLPRLNGVYGFKTDDEFQEWCNDLPIDDVIHRAYWFIHQAQEYEDDDLSSVESAWREFTDKKTELIKSIARKKNFEENSRELFLDDGVLHNNGPLEPRKINSAILYANFNFSGSWKPIYHTIPNLSWIDFNDKTNSIRFSGTGFIAQHPWYRGRKLWLIGHSYMEYKDLREFGFDNRATSVLLTGMF